MRQVFLVLLFSFFLTGVVYGFAIQTEPPINISGFVCQCSFDACLCSQGDIKISVDLTERRSEWMKYAYVHRFMGETFYTCGSYCVDNIGKVTHVSLPFLSLENLRTSALRAEYVKKKSMTFTDRVTNVISDLFQGSDILKNLLSFLGGDKDRKSGTEVGSEDIISIVKEKSLVKSESESESVKNDLTMFLVTQLLRDIFPSKNHLKISDYAFVIRNLVDLNIQGKLVDFITFYLMRKSRGEDVSTVFRDFQLLNVNGSELKGLKKEEIAKLEREKELLQESKKVKTDDRNRFVYLVVVLVAGVVFYVFYTRNRRQKRS